MKKKIYKIMGVALTFVMVLSLFAFSAAPVAADPDENEWSKFSYPEEGSDGDWFWEDTIDYVGPIALAINGDLYCAADTDSEDHLFKSDDGGRTWSKTDYQDDVEGDQIVDIACSSEDADIVYVADEDCVYFTDDGGDTFKELAKTSLTGLFTNETITTLDVGYIDGDPFVFVGTEDTNGGVYFVKHVPGFTLEWTDLNLEGDYAGYDVYSVNCPPNFEDTSTVYAIISHPDMGPEETLIVTNEGIVGEWTQFGGDLEDATSDGDDMAIDAASDICFPDDFDDDELFVGVSRVGGNPGSVYRVTEDPDAAYRLGDAMYDDDISLDVLSLDITGDVRATLLLAGAQDEADVFYSTDDGESWDAADKRPSGEYDTYVLMAEDFADSGEAWAATSDDECAVSYTIDGGDLWNQISLINTEMDDTMLDVSFYPDYETSEKLFMATRDGSDHSLWRYDGEEYWERVASSDVLGDHPDLVQVSPDILDTDTLYIVDDDSPPILYRSTDEGQSWDELKCQPDNIAWPYIGSWIVIDEDTVLVGGVDSDGGGIGSVYKTTNHGNRVWEEIEVDGDAGAIVSFARFEDTDTLLCGDNGKGAEHTSRVFISEDLGDEWDMVGDELEGDADWLTAVAFDTGYADNDTVYAASTNTDNDWVGEIDRFVIDDSDDWEKIVFDAGGNAFDIGVASGIATADGCLYVSDWEEDAGMWRSVDPTADEPLFEQVGTNLGLDPGDDCELYKLMTTSGSNVLWALDWENDNVLWTYEDALVGPVELESPADGEGVDRTNKLTLTWEELADADDYEVRCYADEDFRAAYKVWDKDIGDDEPVLVLTEDKGIEAGTEYWWKVRVAEGEPLVSKWSVVWSTTTAMGAAQWNPFSGPVNEYPWMGATGVPIKPTFAWNTADWATGYEFVLADNDAFTDAFTKTLTSTVYQYETNLDYSTTYYWKVRAVSATGTSNWATGVFTTEAEPIEVVEPGPPVEIPPAPAPITPAWIWAIVVIGAVLVIAVIVLIVMTRRVP